MELRQLRYFLAVAEESNITRAARRLHVSQPALSQQIRAIEKIVGGELFDREPNGVRLTPAGEALLEPASKALAVVTEGIQAARDASLARCDLLRVGIPSTDGLSEMTPLILSAYNATFPTVRMFFRSLDPGELYNGLPDDTIDVALTRLPLNPERCTWTALFEDRRVVGVAVGNPLFEASTVRISDIINMPMSNVVLRSPADAVSAYWMLNDSRGGNPPQQLGGPVSTTSEVAYTILHHSALMCPGPEPIRRYPPLAPSLLRFIDIIDDDVNCAVVARRRSDRRSAVLCFCEIASAITYRLGSAILPTGAKVCAAVPSDQIAIR
jgi:DNA-binding transcriptional LysR family regulator